MHPVRDFKSILSMIISAFMAVYNRSVFSTCSHLRNITKEETESWEKQRFKPTTPQTALQHHSIAARFFHSPRSMMKKLQ